jgi:hypothetical protein
MRRCPRLGQQQDWLELKKDAAAFFAALSRRSARTFPTVEVWFPVELAPARFGIHGLSFMAALPSRSVSSLGTLPVVGSTRMVARQRAI